MGRRSPATRRSERADTALMHARATGNAAIVQLAFRNIFSRKPSEQPQSVWASYGGFCIKNGIMDKSKITVSLLFGRPFTPEEIRYMRETVRVFRYLC